MMPSIFGETIAFWSLNKDRVVEVASLHKPPWSIEEYNGGYRIVPPHQLEPTLEEDTP